MSMWKVIEFFHDSRLIRWIEQKVFTTRMHSSRPACCPYLPACTALGGCTCSGECTCPEGVPAQGVGNNKLWVNHFRKFQLCNMSMWKVIEFFHDSRLIRWIEQKVFTTRMHSSRPACCPYLPACTAPGGVPAPRVYLPRRCTCPGLGVYLPRVGSVPAQGVYLSRYPPLWTECQTGAKILPCPKLCRQ